ncbi:MAG: DUF3526 domain-containing protein [Gammaproteobacteria bacterium]|nr:DUF3526 domain-containing protein [Gammaproteobacteria bacterium]
MIGRLVHKELTELRRDGRALGMLAILLLLALGAGLSAWQQARVQHQAWHAASEGEHARWLEQDAKHPHAAAHYGVYAFRPPGPLAAFDPGLSPYLPVTVWMEAHRQNEALYRPAQDSGSAGGFVALSPAVISGALLPLLLLLLAAPMISGERERGTLRQLLAQGVRPERIVLGKGLALGMLLLLLLLPLWLLVFAGLLLGGADGDVLLRWSLLAVAAALFLGGFSLLCLLVSACCRQSRSALLVLLGIWAFGTLVAPRGVMEWAEARHPTPSALEFRQAIDAGLADGAARERRIEARAEALLQQYGVDDLAALPVNFNAVRLQEGEEHGNRVFDAVFGQLHDGYLAQERWLQGAGWLAPFLAFHGLSSGLAGSDLLHFRHFVDSAEAHRRMIQQLMNDAIYQQPETDGRRYLAGPELWATVPAFDYRPLGVGDVMAFYGMGWAVLLAWFVMPLLALMAVARRLAP